MFDMRTMAHHGDAFLNLLLAAMKLKTDAALAKAFETSAPFISKVRNGRTPISDALIIRAHEETGLSIRELKTYLPPLDGRSTAKICE